MKFITLTRKTDSQEILVNLNGIVMLEARYLKDGEIDENPEDDLASTLIHFNNNTQLEVEEKYDQLWDLISLHAGIV